MGDVCTLFDDDMDVQRVEYIRLLIVDIFAMGMYFYFILF